MEGVEGGDVGGSGGGGGGGRKRVRVLVVDDSPVDRKIVERLLLRSGSGGMFEVIAVDSGKKALEVLGLNEEDDESRAVNDHKVDIILTDYCMPEMNGHELLKAVKAHNLLKSIPVVIMSSENDPQRISRCRACGAEDFILKPLQVMHIQRLRNYARPPAPSSSSKMCTKRKRPVDVTTENNGSERRPRPRLTGVAVA